MRTAIRKHIRDFAAIIGLVLIAVREARRHAKVDRVIFCCFDKATAGLYRAVIARSASPS